MFSAQAKSLMQKLQQVPSSSVTSPVRPLVVVEAKSPMILRACSRLSKQCRCTALLLERAAMSFCCEQGLAQTVAPHQDRVMATGERHKPLSDLSRNGSDTAPSVPNRTMRVCSRALAADRCQPTLAYGRR